MAILSDKIDMPYDEKALHNIKDEEVAGVTRYLLLLIKFLRQQLFSIADVVNINATPPNKTVTGDQTLTEDDRIVLVDASAGPVTISLPVASLSESREYNIKKIDTSGNIVTVDPAGSETIDDDPDFDLLSKDETIRIYCTGTDWVIL